MKKFFYFFAIFLILFFIFSPDVLPETNQFEEVLNSVSQADVIIIFNSGGWGNTPIEQAEDFNSIISGIQEALSDWGYNSAVIPHERTKNNLFGKITGIREFLNSFKSSSNVLAQEIEFLTKKMPDKKIILAGLSAGGALAGETMEKISKESQVYAVAAGTPFLYKSAESQKSLFLSNNGEDTLSVGKLKSLVLSFLKAPVRWAAAKAKGESLSFSQAFYAPGHDYFWDSPDVGPVIISFLEEKIN